ncbi:MAG: hypothetical protein ACTTKF_08305 [Bacteroides sp.]
MTHFWKYLLVFVACILSQVFLLDNIQLLGFVMPYAYPLFILILPTNLSRPWLYIFGFLLGLSIDLFAATLCLHAAATTLLAFLRGSVINFATPQQQLQKTQLPILRTMGVAWTLRYTTVLILAHHTLLHLLAQAPVYVSPWLTALRIGVNTILSVVVILLVEFFIYPPNTNR